MRLLTQKPHLSTRPSTPWSSSNTSCYSQISLTPSSPAQDASAASSKYLRRRSIDSIGNNKDKRPHSQPQPTAKLAMKRDKSHTDKSSILIVFTTPEPCEHILVNLNIYELSRAKSVCRQFSEVINGSPLLQQALFLSPRSSKTICTTLTTEPSRKLLIGPKTADHPGTVQHHASGDPMSEVVIYEKHPALQVEFWPIKGDLLVGAIGAYAYEMRENTGMSAAVNSIVVVSRMTQDSVLHKTYISQPPVTHIHGSVGNSKRPSLHIDISDEHGITFGHLHEGMTDSMALDDGDETPGVRNSRFAKRLLVSFNGGVPVNAKEQRALESLGSREVTLGTDAQNDRDVAYEGKTKEHKKPGHCPWFDWRV
jgi:hypothetical protein